MHELTATQQMLDIALDTARQHGARQITAIDLVLGELSDITAESVQFYFDALSPGTAAEGAALRFRRALAQVCCPGCGYTATPPLPLRDDCPRCGALVSVLGGREFQIESIELE
ncbi:MAG TPA: hydrogenase maturation nickel metallochaperone HypA [Roseiflexaceae bacterium]|nr:hydrogenase maturation nickel metallochaperone HypA [Roseiflexaceae bacterium]